MKLGSGQQPRSHRVPFWRRTSMAMKARVRRTRMTIKMRVRTRIKTSTMKTRMKRRTRMSKRMDLVAVTGAKSLDWAGI